MRMLVVMALALAGCGDPVGSELDAGADAGARTDAGRLADGRLAATFPATPCDVAEDCAPPLACVRIGIEARKTCQPTTPAREPQVGDFCKVQVDCRPWLTCTPQAAGDPTCQTPSNGVPGQ